MKFTLLFILALIHLLCGCSSFNEHIYEGVRTSQKANSDKSNDTVPAKPLPNYDQYEKERQILKNDAH